MNKNEKDKKKKHALDRITKDRVRTNILRRPEQAALACLVQRIPKKVTSDALTYIGLLGNFVVAASFVLAAHLHVNYLLVSVPGFIINWFGDSLDGRLAYYRNKPRKWYGFMLDVTVDWIGIIAIGIGFMIYVGSPFYILGFLFVVLYGWEMITALLRYKIIDKYSIDSGIMGPTEVRVIIALILVVEIIIPTSIIYSIGFIILLLLVSNITETRKLMHFADLRDVDENVRKEIIQRIEEMQASYEALN